MEGKVELQMVTDAVPQLIWTNDHEGKANYFNSRWYEYTGLTYAESAVLGWQVVAHNEDKHAINEWESAFVEKRLFESEVRILRHDGHYEWHLLRNVPLIDSRGSVQSWFGSATNIEKIKINEQNFKRSSSFLKAILDGAMDFAIITVDRNGVIVGWSTGAVKMFGYEEKEAIGKRTEILFTEEDRQGGIPKKEIETTIATGRCLDERWHLRKDGTRFFMSGVMTPMPDFEGFVKVTRNITDRKLGEEALLMAEHRNSIAMHSAQMGEWQCDLVKNSVTINDITARILGMPDPVPSISMDEFWNYIHPEDLANIKSEFEKAVAGLNMIQAEFRIAPQGNDEYKWVNFYGRAIYFDQNSPRQMLGVMYDITERKLLEKQKDDFLAVASHELKTPVTSIKAYTELLQDTFERTEDNENAELVWKLNKQVDRLIRLFNVLLDSTKLTGGKLHINPEQFNVNDLLVEQVEEFTRLSPRRKILYTPTATGLVHADKDKIAQVISNLISNALKFSPESKDIIISSHDELDGVMVRVQDFGPGISTEEQQRIFKQYYRGKAKSVSGVTGFGLGLYIAAEIIRQHHGLIGVESIPGEGATFYFKLRYT